MGGRVLPAMPYEEYDRIEGANWSKLKTMQKSAKHYKHALSNQRKDTPSLLLGRATHTAVLEPERFLPEYAYFDGDKRTKEWKAFKIANRGRDILDGDDYRRCLAMSKALHADPVTGPYLESGRAEVPIVWTDKDTGLPCKARLDWLSDSKPALVDLKTTRSVDGFLFGRDAAKYGYHCQLAHYQAAYASTDGPPLEVVIIAVESEPPHDCAAFIVDADALYAGAEEVASLLVKLKYSVKSGHWPGRYTEAQPLQLPPWIYGDEEDVSDLTFAGEAA